MNNEVGPHSAGRQPALPYEGGMVPMPEGQIPLDHAKERPLTKEDQEIYDRVLISFQEYQGNFNSLSLPRIQWLSEKLASLKSPNDSADQLIQTIKKLAYSLSQQKRVGAKEIRGWFTATLPSAVIDLVVDYEPEVASQAGLSGRIPEITQELVSRMEQRGIKKFARECFQRVVLREVGLEIPERAAEDVYYTEGAAWRRAAVFLGFATEIQAHQFFLYFNQEFEEARKELERSGDAKVMQLLVDRSRHHFQEFFKSLPRACTTLDLSGCSLVGRIGLGDLYYILSFYRHLTVLNLENCGCKTIRDMTNFTKLEELNISNNCLFFRADDTKVPKSQIKFFLKQLPPNLKKLDLRGTFAETDSPDQKKALKFLQDPANSSHIELLIDPPTFLEDKPD